MVSHVGVSSFSSSEVRRRRRFRRSHRVRRAVLSRHRAQTYSPTASRQHVVFPSRVVIDRFPGAIDGRADDRTDNRSDRAQPRRHGAPHVVSEPPADVSLAEGRRSRPEPTGRSYDSGVRAPRRVSVPRAEPRSHQVRPCVRVSASDHHPCVGCGRATPAPFRLSSLASGIRVTVLCAACDRAHGLSTSSSSTLEPTPFISWVAIGLVCALGWHFRAHLIRQLRRLRVAVVCSMLSAVRLASQSPALCVAALLLGLPFASAAEDDSRRVPQWTSADGYAHWRVFFSLLVAYLAQQAGCMVLVRSHPEQLSEIQSYVENRAVDAETGDTLSKTDHTA